MREPEKKQDAPSVTLSGCFYQVVWSLLGPGLVLIAGSICIVEKKPFGSVQDWFLLGAVIVAIAARFLDRTVPSAPSPGEAPPPSPKKYAAWIAGAGVLVFLVAHYVAPHLL